MTAHVVLNNPKFAHNVGGALRAASCFDAESVWFTGKRISKDNAAGAPWISKFKTEED